VSVCIVLRFYQTFLPSTRPVPHTRTSRPAVRLRRPFPFNRFDLRPTSSKYHTDTDINHQHPCTENVMWPIRCRIFWLAVLPQWPAAVCVLGRGWPLSTCSVPNPPNHSNHKSSVGVLWILTDMTFRQHNTFSTGVLPAPVFFRFLSLRFSCLPSTVKSCAVCPTFVETRALDHHFPDLL